MNADQQQPPPPVPPRSQLESLPSSVATLTLLPYAQSSELLIFRAVCQTAYAFVHGHSLTLGAAVAAGGDAGDAVASSSNATGAADNSTRTAAAAAGGVDASDAVASCSNANAYRNDLDEATSEEEANILWRRTLSVDFGFMSEEEEKELGQYNADKEFAQTSAEFRELVEGRRKYRRMFLRTFRHRPTRTSDNDDSTERSFLETGEVFTASTPFASWKHWAKLHKQFQNCAAHVDATTSSSSDLCGPYYLRAAALWQKIENWCDDQGSFGLRMKNTLVPGRALDVASLIGDDDDDSDPRDFFYSTLQALWSFYGGQKRPTGPADFAMGLLGGYCAYDILCCSRLIGIDEIIAPRRGMAGGLGTILPFAHNVTGQTQKVVVVVRHLGRAFVAVANSLMPCDVLEWLDAYATRLERGVYEIGELVPQHPQQAPFDTRSILLYPTIADTMGRTSRAVTNGIEVIASGVDAVERQGMFIYSIRIRILTPGEGGYMSPSQRGFTTCQLRSRHWIISQGNGREPEHVRGDGVVGMYPLLKEGGYDLYEGRTAATVQEVESDCEGKFAYQSMTEASEEGTLGGSLQFVPGSLANPTGQEFDVRVAPFPLGEERILF